LLEDDPESFEELAREHSISDTKSNGGHIGRITRGMMPPEVEAKVFQGNEGKILGPFPVPGGSAYEVFRVNAKSPARLDTETTDQIRRVLREEWLAARAGESRIEIC
jgi:parvulin-like peptidyl-prolyl isomerase